MYLFIAAEFKSKEFIELSNKMYALAINLLADEQLYQFTKDVTTPYATLLLENRLLKDAMTIYEKELLFAQALKREHHINKVAMCILALILVDNPGAKEEKFREICRCECFPMSPEYSTISELYDAYDEGNQQKYDAAARKVSWNHIEAPVFYI
jgi:hypothetical protein